MAIGHPFPLPPCLAGHTLGAADMPIGCALNFSENTPQKANGRALPGHRKLIQFDKRNYTVGCRSTGCRTRWCALRPKNNA
jgi:hypothetical protein